MHLQQAVKNVFAQLAETIEKLTPSQYIQPCSHLGNNTIGQHVRHIIELFQCLENGYESEKVNYEKRKRDVSIETNKPVALTLLNRIFNGLDRPDKPLSLEACYDDHTDQPLLIATNYYREVAYNLEHTIHHMALIRVGIKEVSELELPENFGVASSTVKHRRECAQ